VAAIKAEDKDKQRDDPSTSVPQKIEGYGVANPISEVLERLRIDDPKSKPAKPTPGRPSDFCRLSR